VFAPEFIQDEILPIRMADALDVLFDVDSPRRKDVIAGLAEVRSRLGSPGAADRVARIVSDLLTPAR